MSSEENNTHFSSRGKWNTEIPRIHTSLNKELLNISSGMQKLHKCILFKAARPCLAFIQ